MRVLMIAQSCYDYDPRILRFTSALRDQNANVDILCLQYNDQSAFDEINGVRVYRIMKNFSQETIFSYVFGSLRFLFKAMIKSFFLSLKEKYAVVHIHNMPDYLVFAALFPKLNRVPVILDIHDLTVELFKEKWAEKKFNRFQSILKFVEKISCNFADHVVTVTRECVDILIERGIKPQKISLIMNSADEGVFAFSKERFNRKGNNRFKFLYHGTVANRFGLHFFIEAMPQIVNTIPNSEFHIYGAYIIDYSTELKKRVEELNLDKHVIFKEAIPYANLNDMIKEYDLGVVPYARTEYMNLALPTKACEYALSGLPFIITNLKSVKSVFREESVCFIEPDSPEMIFKTVVDLYNNLQKRISLAENAFIDVKSISWSIMKDKYFIIIDQLVKRKKI